MERNNATNTIRLGSIFGVTIAIHFTWFVIFALITFSMAGTFAASFPGLPPAANFLIGVAASLLFFGSVLFHEMAHSLMAIRSGKPVRSITLFIFGGVSEIGKEADRPGEEIRIALVGPASSYFLAVVFGGLWLLSRGRSPVIGEVSQWLATVNLILGTFNLLPGIPLDGGRVLRGIAWSVTGDKDRATRLAVGAGRTIGYLMIIGGVFMAFRLNHLFNGVWLGFLGWFLVHAAEMEWRRTAVDHAIAGVTASEVMSRDCPSVPGDTSLTEFVEHFLLRSGRRCYMVVESEAPRGLITLNDVLSVPRNEWGQTSVQAAMRRADQIYSVSPDAELADALRLMDEKNVAQVPVTLDGRVLGIIGRDHLIRLILNRAALEKS
ncbi:MAG TPA: site-2 protease family protein [Blastocatellia bacterium]|jgi:Zn-dependent protease|nr:site-2 protease family protein [Blastocatellia bacterium]